MVTKNVTENNKFSVGSLRKADNRIWHLKLTILHANMQLTLKK